MHYFMSANSNFGSEYSIVGHQANVLCATIFYQVWLDGKSSRQDVSWPRRGARCQGSFWWLFAQALLRSLFIKSCCPISQITPQPCKITRYASETHPTRDSKNACRSDWIENYSSWDCKFRILSLRCKKVCHKSLHIIIIKWLFVVVRR